MEGLGGGRAADGICEVSRRWRKGVRVSAQPAALQLLQSRRARGRARDICAMPAQGRSRIDSVAATPSAVQGDATRGAIGADRARIIDRRDSVVTAEPDEERLLLRAMATSRKCVLARAVSTTLASRRRRPYLLLIPRTWRLELRRRESSLRPYNRPSPASRRVQLAKPPNVETSPRQNPWVPTGLMHRFSPRRHPLLAQAH